MKKQIAISFSVFAVITIVVFAACSKSGSSTTGPVGNPSTGTDSVLSNLGKNIILPSYQQLSASASSLDASVTAFNTSPNETSLADVQQKFKDAYTNWAACSEFEFGPADDQSLTTHFTNSFPADTNIINSNINGATYAIDGINNFAAQGFPAIDYLLFSGGTSHVLARFTTGATAAGAKKYLSDVTASLKSKTAAVAAAWADTYLDQFIKNTGTDAGSSLSLLVNAYVKDFDVTLQNYKIGIPIGLYGMNVLPKAPGKVEAYYSGISDALLVAQVQACQNIYTGGSGKSLDDKVIATGVQKDGAPLNVAINNQLATLLTKMQALPQPLSQGVANGDQKINDAYNEVRQMTVLLKVDMCSALGIRISFSDDDGD